MDGKVQKALLAVRPNVDVSPQPSEQRRVSRNNFKPQKMRNLKKSLIFSKKSK